MYTYICFVVGILNDPLKPQTPVLTSSRLSKTLHEVLHDKDALPYFIQYMTSRSAEQIIKFWLDSESFQASSWTRIRSQSLRSTKQNAGPSSPKLSPVDVTTESASDARKRLTESHDTVDSGQVRNGMPKSESCASNSSQVSSHASGIATCASSDTGSVHEECGECACSGALPADSITTNASGSSGTDASSVHMPGVGILHNNTDCSHSSGTTCQCSHTSQTVCASGQSSGCSSQEEKPSESGATHNANQHTDPLHDKLIKSKHHIHPSGILSTSNRIPTRGQ